MTGALPPWQQLPYFRTPVFRFVTLTGNVDRLVTSDPMRVLIVLASTSGSVLVGPGPQLAVPYNGIQLGTRQISLTLDHGTYGPLVNGEWYAITPNAGDVVTVLEVSLSQWPQPAAKPQPPPQAPWYRQWMNALQGKL